MTSINEVVLAIIATDTLMDTNQKFVLIRAFVAFKYYIHQS